MSFELAIEFPFLTLLSGGGNGGGSVSSSSNSSSKQKQNQSSSSNQHQHQHLDSAQSQILISELDKIFTSNNVGDQCMAIAVSTRLIKQNRLSLQTIEQTISRLIEIFRVSEINLVRFRILKGLIGIDFKLFSRLLNSNELLRRVSGVLQSNDPIARAITLRYLLT